MIFTGADLIKISDRQVERATKRGVVEPPSAAVLENETQSALRRFARFVQDERSARKPRSKDAKKGVSKAYAKQIEALNETPHIFDIYV